MTEQERIDRIAAWMGWTRRNGNKWGLWIKDGIGIAPYDWNPLESLDDCRLVEEEVARRGLDGDYEEAVCDVVGGMDVTYAIMYLTARQRCEAVEKLVEEGK
jgi:hypothetical protein